MAQGKCYILYSKAEVFISSHSYYGRYETCGEHLKQREEKNAKQTKEETTTPKKIQKGQEITYTQKHRSSNPIINSR